MKAQLPHPEHFSYLQHRKQRFTQVILPMLIAALFLVLLIVLISISTFSKGGEVSRWAAISIMWLAIPMLFAGLITLALLCGLVYGMALLLGALPFYTELAQHYVQVGRAYILRGAEIITKPVIAVELLTESVRKFFGRE